MNVRDVLRGFGEVDDALVQEMVVKGRNLEQQKKRKGANIMKIMGMGTGAVAAAAAVAGIILISFGRFPGDPVKKPSETQTEQAYTVTPETETAETGAETEAPAAEEEAKMRFRISAQDGNVVIYDMEQEAETAVLENAVAIIGNRAMEGENPVLLFNSAWEGQGTGYAEIVLRGSIDWEADRPLAIRFPGSTGDGSDDRCGIYSIEEGRFICSPEEHSRLFLLGDELWTDAEQMLCGGSLMRMDGTVVAHTDSPAGFRRYVNYIVAPAEGHVYDLHGNYMFSYDPESCTLLDVPLYNPDKESDDEAYNEYFTARFTTPPQSYINSAAYAEGTWMTDTFFMNIGMWNAGQESYCVERNGWDYMGHAGSLANFYTNWYTGSGYVIKRWQNMAEVGSIADTEFYAKNPEYFPAFGAETGTAQEQAQYVAGTRFQAAGTDPDTGNLIIMVTEFLAPEYRTVVRYLYCDEEYRVVKETAEWEGLEEYSAFEKWWEQNLQG